uniref:Intraflagellar transport protein 46 homolog n=1 Tax=Parastrongyloides trichosuri TaxID=131310 RepID=A0A0N4Z8N0_PARTI
MNNNREEMTDGDDISKLPASSIDKKLGVSENINDINIEGITKEDTASSGPFSRSNTFQTSEVDQIDYLESLSDFEENERLIKSEVILEESLEKSQFNELKKELTDVEEEDTDDLLEYQDESDMEKEDDRGINSPKTETLKHVDSNEIEEIVQQSYSPDYPTGPPPAYAEDDGHSNINQRIKNIPDESYYNFELDSNKTYSDEDEEEDYGDDNVTSEHNDNSNNETGGIKGMATAFTGLTGLAKAFSQPKFESSKEPSFSEDERINSPEVVDSEKPQTIKNGKIIVTPELTKLFDMIEDYIPIILDPPYRLLPFIPDYAPAVGDVDPFIKIPRPDEVEDNLGLTILDEPASEQSDPMSINLLMSKVYKDVSNIDNKDAPVRQVPSSANKNVVLDQWITNIKEIQTTRQATTVPHSKNLPDIEYLMQEWPESFEKILAKSRLPTADLNVDLKQFVDICLGIVDIPVVDSRIKSLHVFFSLYAEFKKSQHFKNLSVSNGYSQYGENNKNRNTDRLEL